MKPALYLELGHKYRKGDGVGQNHLEALRLYQLYASERNSDGEAWVAYYNLQGDGPVNHNTQEAFRLFKLGGEKKKFHLLIEILDIVIYMDVV